MRDRHRTASVLTPPFLAALSSARVSELSGCLLHHRQPLPPLPSVCPEHEGWPDMNAAAIRPAPAARRRPAAGFSCAAATLNLPSMNDVATPGVEASSSEEHTSELQPLMRP